MEILLSATEISEHVNMYNTLSKVFIVISVLFAVIAIVLWIKLRIMHSIKVLLGMGVDKEIRQISEDTRLGNTYSKQSHSKAVLSWNTSGLLAKQEVEETTLLEDVQDEETQLLSEMETTVLDTNNTVTSVSSDDFEIEEEIIITGKGNL